MLDPWRESVRPAWIDYNGHLSEAYYVLTFGPATDAVMAQVGLGEDHRRRTSTSLFTSRRTSATSTRCPTVRSSRSGLRWSAPHRRCCTLWHEMWADDRLRATEEVLGVHVDAEAGRSTPFPDEVASRIAALLTEPPEHSGRSIRIGS